MLLEILEGFFFVPLKLYRHSAYSFLLLALYVGAPEEIKLGTGKSLFIYCHNCNQYDFDVVSIGKYAEIIR